MLNDLQRQGKTKSHTNLIAGPAAGEPAFSAAGARIATLSYRRHKFLWIDLKEIVPYILGQSPLAWVVKKEQGAD